MKRTRIGAADLPLFLLPAIITRRPSSDFVDYVSRHTSLDERILDREKDIKSRRGGFPVIP
jgi:hypothetical protein